MIDPSLVLQLLALLNCRKLLICYDFEDDTSVADSLAYLGSQASIAVTIVDLDGNALHEELFDARDLRKSLIVQCVPPSNAEFMKSSIHWLVSFNKTLVQSLPLRLDSDFMTYQNGDSGSIEIKEWYKIKDSLMPGIRIGHWTPSGGLKTLRSLKWDRRNDFKGTSLNGATIDWEGVGELKNNEKGQPVLTGMMGDTLMDMASMLNFTVKASKVSWHKLHPNDSFSGAVMSLIRHEVDVVVAGIPVAPEQVHVVDYTAGIFDNMWTLVVKNPALFENEGINMMAYLSVFSLSTWLLMLLTSIIAGSLYLVGLILGNGITTETTVIKPVFLKIDLSSPKKSSFSFRLLVVTATLSGFLFHTHFGADLTAILTTGPSVVPILSFQDALDQGYTVLTFKGTYLAEILQDAPSDSAMSQIRTEFVDGRKFFEVEGRVEHSSRGDNLALFTSALNYMKNQTKILMPIMNLEEATRAPMAFGLQLDSEFSSVLNYGLTKARQSGLLRLSKHKWLQGDKPKDATKRIFQEEARALAYDHLFFPSFLLIIGMGLSVLLWILEKFTFLAVDKQSDETDTL